MSCWRSLVLQIGEKCAEDGGNTDYRDQLETCFGVVRRELPHSQDDILSCWQLYFDESRRLNKLMVVDFTATWCGPCKFMAPVFEAMAAKYIDVDFVKIDVDELSDVAREFAVQAMPSFVLLKQGNEVDRVVGAKKDELENKICKHREAPKFAA